jgi:hypothetical protein
MKTKSAIIILIALMWGTLSAQTSNWTKIGETIVDFKQEKDEIKAMGADRYSALKFKVSDAAVDFIDMDVFYDDGKSQNIKVNSPVKAGAESGKLDIMNNDRGIKKIVFVYKTIDKGKDEKAKVEVWGLKMADKDHKRADKKEDKKD